MSGNRFRIVFLLLVLILLVVSALFGALTYWLDGEVLSSSAPVQEGSGLAVGCTCRVVPRGVVPTCPVTQALQRIGGQA